MKLRTLVLAFGAGAATMYLFDRDHGAERRQQLTDKAEGLLGSTGEAVDEARQLGVEAARVGYDARDAVAEVAGAVTDGPPSSGPSSSGPSPNPTPGA